MKPVPKTRSRAEAMAAMYRAGKRYHEIGEAFGVTSETARYLVKKYCGLARYDGGAARHPDARITKRLGCTREQHVHMLLAGVEHKKAGGSRATTPLAAFALHRRNAAARGVEWNLNAWEWWTIWQESGRWAQRGPRSDQYVMCRYGDVGPYAVGNVYIATAAHNNSVHLNNPYRVDHPDHERFMAEVASRRVQGEMAA